MVCLKKVLTLE